MSKHTPGPWKASKTHLASSDTWYVIIDPEGRGPIMEVGGKDKPGQIADAKYLVTDPSIIEANAHLIASAPELLEACKFARMQLSALAKEGRYDKGWEIIQQAISKAEGK